METKIAEYEVISVPVPCTHGHRSLGGNSAAKEVELVPKKPFASNSEMKSMHKENCYKK